MKFLFDDESFSFETLRTAGFGPYGGADLGEVLVTVAAITGGDEASWHRAWKAIAERLQSTGEKARAVGYRVSARQALLRASNYYRTAADFLLEKPATDPEMTVLSAGQHDAFAAAAALFDSPVHDVSVPYLDTGLAAYLFLVDDSGAPRPTIIMQQRIRLHPRGVLLRDRRRALSLRHWDIGQHGVWGGLVAAERVALAAGHMPS